METIMMSFYVTTGAPALLPLQSTPRPIILELEEDSQENATFNSTKLITDTDSYLQQLSDQMAVTLLPAILIISTIMIVAFFGNTLVFYVYYTKFNASSTRSAILALAFFDLAATCLSMPGEIVDLRYSYNFQNIIVCKCSRLVTTVVLVSSGLTLLVVAVDRYRRICHPMKDQLTASQTKKCVLICLFAALIFSTPAAVIYGLSRVPTTVEGVYGTECSIDQKYRDQIWPLLNNILQGLIFLSVFVCIIVLYILLGRVVLRQSRFRQSVRKTSKEEADRDHSITDGTRDFQRTDDDLPSPTPDIIPDRYFADSNVKDAEMATERKKSMVGTRRMSVFNRGNRKLSNDDTRTRKTTVMLFTISIVFVISFLPHLVLKLLQAIKKDFPSSSSTSETVLYNVFVRSYFFNSVANCFIYGFCSPKFKRETKQVLLTIFQKIFCCCKKK